MLAGVGLAVLLSIAVGVGLDVLSTSLPQRQQEMLETVVGEDFSDWLAPRDRSGGLVGARPAGKGQAKNGFQNSPGPAK